MTRVTVHEHVEVRWIRATERRWLEVDPVLAASEPGHEIDTGRFKIGDGITKWSHLPYFVPRGGSGGSGLPADESTVALIEDHVMDPNPHPAYDQGESFLLLYENAKV